VRDSQDPASFFQDVLVGERKDRDVGCVGGLSFGVAADETHEGDSIEVHTFLLVPPDCLGHRKASGRGSQDKKLLFWGTETGEPEPEGCESKAEASQLPGAAKAPKQCRDERAGQGNATEGPPLCWSRPL
jgi:hypothetical protein